MGLCSSKHIVLPPVHARPRRSAGVTFNSKTLAALYGFPTAGDTLPSVAIIELGGGYEPADLSKFCSKIGIPVPAITNISIDGTNNVPGGDPDGADGEVALDMQNIIGATLGKAPLVMLWAPNNDTGMADALQWVAANAVSHNICAVSLSWGASEGSWDSISRSSTDAGLQACQKAGVPVFAASGDNGSSDGGSGNNVDYPACSPYCFGCGGTTSQVVNGSLSEVVWEDCGGGYSLLYAAPPWQLGDPKAQRLVPDGAMNADPSTGYDVFVDGVEQTIGGTSAVAPMFAALIACLRGGGAKNLGLFNQQWYALPSSAITDIVNGSNGTYHAGIGLDPCTGRGSPKGGQVLVGLAGGSTPPPPPPPVSGATRTLPQVLAAVDAEFGQLEKDNPKLASILKQVDPFVDGAITKAFGG